MKRIRPSGGVDNGVHGVARGARHVVNHRSFLADELIEERRFPNIGSTDDGDVECAVVNILTRDDFILFRTDEIDNSIEKVSRTSTVKGGDGERLARAK